MWRKRYEIFGVLLVGVVKHKSMVGDYGVVNLGGGGCGLVWIHLLRWVCCWCGSIGLFVFGLSLVSWVR